MKNLFWLFFIVVIPAYGQTPKWVKTPVEHWSCPSGYMLDNTFQTPHCSKRPKWNQTAMHVDLTKQEYILWRWTKKLDKNGKFQLDFPKEISEPGCRVVPGFPDVTVNGKTVKGKPGEAVVLDCYGIVNR